jgi:hypothetical protein
MYMKYVILLIKGNIVLPNVFSALLVIVTTIYL